MVVCSYGLFKINKTKAKGIWVSWVTGFTYVMLFWKTEQICIGYSERKTTKIFADFVCLSTDKEIFSLILMVGLFEQWETE